MRDAAFIDFIVAHADDDPAGLLLSASRWPGVDIKEAASAIAARRRIRDKLPSWHAVPAIEYPGSLSLEQCSSEAAALYKQQFVAEGETVADITGGLGVDSWALSRKASALCYLERQQPLCDAALNNFRLLGADNITVRCADSLDYIAAAESGKEHFDLIYADPARRGSADRRVYAIEDCEPDIISLKGMLLSLADRLLVKVSPMADISRTAVQIPEAREIHVVAVGGEVKELLVHCSRGARSGECRRVATDLKKGWSFSFTPQEESGAASEFADAPMKYLYQPSKALLKAGAYKLAGSRFGLKKFAVSTHLYTSDTLVSGFPGKVFGTVEAMEWGKPAISRLRSGYRALEMTALNFPLDTAALRKRLGIAEGGDCHLFAFSCGSRRMCVTAEPLKMN